MPYIKLKDRLLRMIGYDRFCACQSHPKVSQLFGTAFECFHGLADRAKMESFKFASFFHLFRCEGLGKFLHLSSLFWDAL